MNTTTQKAVEALDLLPEDMREPAVAYLVEQAEKFHTLKALVQEGLDDVEAGRVIPFDMNEILALAKRKAKED